MCSCPYSYHNQHRQFVTHLRSFPSYSQRICHLPLLKKPTLDKDQLSNYQPICNLSLISKIIERVVKSRLTDHLVSNGVFSIPTSLPTASITPLKQRCCISMIISSMPSDHRSCHVFASLICLPLLTPSTTTS